MYWPKSKSRSTFGEIKVQNMEEETWPDYIIRTFNVEKVCEHYHH